MTPKEMEKFKNMTLDSLTIAAIASGISMVPDDRVSGLIIVGIGMILSYMKYRLRLNQTPIDTEANT